MDLKWTSEKRKLNELLPAEYNPRRMTEKQAEDLKKSIEKFELADPIVINKDNRIIGGHMRVNILSAKGVEEVDVRVPSRQLTEEEEKELNLRLNKNLGEWDFDKLSAFDTNVLLDVGFQNFDLGIKSTIAGTESFERPSYDNCGVDKKAGNEMYFYVEFYEDETTWNMLTEKLQPYLTGLHTIDKQFFKKMVENAIQ